MQAVPNAPIEALLETIGEDLKLRMKQARLDQKSLAELADLNRNTVSAALSGNDIKLSTLIRLTRVLGFSDWLQPLLEQPSPSPMQLLSKPRKPQADTQKERPSSRKLGRQK